MGCTFSSVIYYGLAMIGDFCKEERSMKFEESYDRQGMFLEVISEGISIENEEEKGSRFEMRQKGVKEGSSVVEL